MGQRRRQAREELERREKNVTSGASSGLGPGGEARVAAVKLEELRKQGDALRQQQSVARSAAWDTARASTKKRRASWDASVSGADNDDEELEERTVRVKWSTKKQSHSDHTLDVLFSRFGKVESVSIEEGRGDRAFVTFAASSSADAAVEEYRDGETLRANFVGKRRTKRSGIFAPRRQTMSPTRHRSGAAKEAEGGDISQSSFRDRESLVMMKLRQEAERQALIRKIAEQQASAVVTTPGKGKLQSGDVAANEASFGTPIDHVNGNNGAPVVGKSVSNFAVGACVKPSTGLDEGGVISSGGGGSETPSAGNEQAGGADPIFPVPSPAIARTPNNFSLRRESDLLSTSMSVAGGLKRSKPSVVSAGGSSSVPTTPASDREAKGVGAGSIDEGDILARMFATKR